jgi:ABC-type transport system involved in multi-copper enzyme maturation permease subunit
MAKELRIRMRTWRTFALVGLYLLGLGGIGLIFFTAQFHSVRMGYGSLYDVGQQMFAFLAVLQFVLVYFAVPALTANSVSGERERQTFDLLACTQLSPVGIVAGKLASALSAVVLLIVSSLPLYGFVFLMGGVSPRDLSVLMGILLVTTIIAGCWSLMFSSILKRTVSAVVASYALNLFLIGGTLIIATLVTEIFYRSQTTVPAYLLLLLNPLSLFEWLYPEQLLDMIRELSQRNYPYSISWLKFWHLSLLVNSVLAALCLWVSTRAVNPLRAGRRKG